MLFRFLILIHVCAAFPLKCPEPAQWSLRARSHCPDPSKYFCLKNDLINGYSENCTVFDFLQPGRKNVLRGGLDADICSSNRYQPWPITFFTNASTNCIFLKSMCNEEGQVIYDKGNRNIDTSCRCDYTRGYDFLFKPRNFCFCVPSKEDCSCYLKTFSKATDKLSPDYECYQEDKNLTVSEFEAIINQRVNTTRNKNIMEYISMREKSSNTVQYKIILTVICIGLIFFFCMGVLLDTLLDRFFREENLFPKKCSHCMNMSRYWCYDCRTVLCEDHLSLHKKRTANSTHSIQPITDSYKLIHKFCLVGTRISNIDCLSDKLIVATTNEPGKELVTFSINGKQQKFKSLDGDTISLAVLDSNTIVVSKKRSLVNFDTSIVSIENVTSTECIKDLSMGDARYLPLKYKENNVFIALISRIYVADMAGYKKGHIDLEFTPGDMCYNDDSKRFYCVDSYHSKLNSFGRDGKDIFTFTDPNMKHAYCLDIDNDGNVLLLCQKRDDRSGCVLEVDSYGKSTELVISNIQLSGSYLDSCLCFHRYTNSVVIGVDGTVYVYRKDPKG